MFYNGKLYLFLNKIFYCSIHWRKQEKVHLSQHSSALFLCICLHVLLCVFFSTFMSLRLCSHMILYTIQKKRSESQKSGDITAEQRSKTRKVKYEIQTIHYTQVTVQLTHLHLIIKNKLQESCDSEEGKRRTS